MTSIRRACTAAVSATALALAACGNSGSSTTETAMVTATEQASEVPAAQLDVEKQALTPDCSLGIEATAAQAIVDSGAAPVVIINGPHDGEITNLEILEDAYAPCDGLSHAIIGGTYQGEPAAFPVFFSHGATISGVASFLGTPDMTLTGDGTTITATDAGHQATYTADQFGSVTERSQGTGNKNVDLSGFALHDATPRTTTYNFPVGGGTARCLVGPEDLQCENPGTWAVRYDYGRHELVAVDRVDDSAAFETVALTEPHTVVGPPGHLMDLALGDDGLTITTADDATIRISADEATM